MSCAEIDQKYPKVRYIKITHDEEGQRIDNFLQTFLKGVPKSRIYRLIRKGEVRVNKKRVSAFYKLKAADELRIPPVYLAEKAKAVAPSQETSGLLAKRILYEDDNLLIINKPSGMSVHAGSTVRMGVIEALRYVFPKLKQLELAHRLDSETSGCLILAKKKKILRELHALLREGKITKIYWALTQGVWHKKEYLVDASLHKFYEAGGKHVVRVAPEGKKAKTEFRPIKSYPHATLVEATLLTGRTHQIRVHAASVHHPIAGDDRYGNAEFNKSMKAIGIKRLFLHAHSLDFVLPSLNQRIRVVAPMDKDLVKGIKALDK